MLVNAAVFEVDIPAFELCELSLVYPGIIIIGVTMVRDQRRCSRHKLSGRILRTTLRLLQTVVDPLVD